VSAPPPVLEQSDDAIYRIHSGTAAEEGYKCKHGAHLELKPCMHRLGFTGSKRMEVAKKWA
jgi:hypothetical protein